jgi:hypothetical protein
MNHPSQMPPIQPRRPHQPLLPVELELSLSSELTDLLTRFLDILEPIMSKLTDAVDALTNSVNSAVERSQVVVDGLNKQIADLQAQLANTGLSQAEEDAIGDKIEGLKAIVDALDASKPATLPPDGTVTPVPAPAPAPADGGTPPTPPTP